MQVADGLELTKNKSLFRSDRSTALPPKHSYRTVVHVTIKGAASVYIHQQPTWERKRKDSTSWYLYRGLEREGKTRKEKKPVKQRIQRRVDPIGGSTLLCVCELSCCLLSPFNDSTTLVIGLERLLFVIDRQETPLPLSSASCHVAPCQLLPFNDSTTYPRSVQVADGMELIWMSQ